MWNKNMVFGIMVGVLMLSSMAFAKPLVLSIGDSIVCGGLHYTCQLENGAGTGNINNTFQYWIDHYGKYNSSALGSGTNIEIYNWGNDGDTCSGVNSRYNSEITNNSDVFVLCGINDILDGIPAANIENNLTQIAAKAKAKNDTLFVMELLPYDGRTGVGPDCSQEATVNAWIDSYFTTNGSRVVHTYSALSNSTPCSQGNANRNYFENQALNTPSVDVHPNKAGYQVIGYLAAQALNSTSSPTFTGNITVSLTNSQSSGTLVNMPQMIQINAFSPFLINHLSSNLGNIRFYYNNTELHSWCESNCTNKSVNAVFWVKLPVSIPASSRLNLTLKIGNMSENYDGAYAGEAPQLTNSYGQYDNGKSVFSYYYNFSGTTLPSGLHAYNGGTGTITDTVNDGLTFGVSGGYSTAEINTTPYTAPSSPLIVEELATSLTPSNNYESAGIAEGNSYYSNVGYSFIDKYAGANVWDISRWGGEQTIGTNHALNGIIGGAWISTGKEMLEYNYSTMLTSTDSSQTLSSYPLGMVVSNDYPSGSGYDYLIQWFRARYYPPNGIMPSVSFSEAGSPSSTTTTTTTTTTTSTTSTADSSSSTSTAPTTTIPGIFGVNCTVMASFVNSNMTLGSLLSEVTANNWLEIMEMKSCSIS